MKPIKGLMVTVLSTAPTMVHWTGWSSLTLLVLKVLWLDRVPEWFPSAYELGVLTQNVLGSVVAAYVFFLISYQLPLVLERKSVAPTIAMLVDQTMLSVVSFLYDVNFSLNAKNRSATLPFPVTEAIVVDLFSRIDPNGESPHWSTGTMAVVSWFSCLMDHKAESIKYVDHLWRYSRFIDAELAALLESIRFCQHVRSLNSHQEIAGNSFRVGNTDMSVWAPAYFHYYQLGMELQAYGVRFRAMYGVTDQFSRS